MKISELKEYQKVRRPLKDELGNRLYEEINFYKAYNLNEKNLNRRLFSKIIDISFALIIQILISKFEFLNTDNLLITLLILFVLTISISSILETTLGSSFGKIILDLEVVNDNCKHLTLIQSFQKNIYSFGLFLIIFFQHLVVGTIDFYNKWLKKNSFYIIRRTKKDEIKQMMKAQNPLNTQVD